jgi:trigger factor
MKNTVKKINDSKVEVTVDVDKDLWQAAQKKAAHKLEAAIEVPGFRPGRAPEEMLRARVSPEKIFNEAIDDVLSPVFAQLITEEKLRPFARPGVAINKVSPDELEIVYTIILVPEVTLGAYKDLHAEKLAPAVTDQEIDDAIKGLLTNNASLAVVEREAKLGDTVVFDFDGYLPDEKGTLTPFEGGKADNYSLELGSHQFVPGFEEALVGVTTGSDKDVEVTFPTNYVKDLAGKKAIFKCKIHEIKEKQIPSLADASVKDLGIKDVDTIDKLREHEKTTLLAEKVSKASEDYYNAIVAQIVTSSQFTLAQEIIDNEAAGLEDNLKKQVEQQGLTFEQYLDISGEKEEDLKKKFAEQAEKNIKAFIVLQKIADVEKITVTDQNLEDEISKIALQYGMKPEEVKNALAKNLDQFKDNLRERKIRDYILSVSK